VKGIKSAWRLTFLLYVGDYPHADEHAIEGTRWTKQTRVEPATRRRHQEAAIRVLSDGPRFLLRNMNVRTVVLNGGFTDCRVLNAAFDASNPQLPRRRAARSRPRHERGDEEAALKMVSMHSAW
jgi:hypothetical protein